MSNLGIYLVPKKGLEPPHPCEYVDLNHARLPIPPLRHGRDCSGGFPRAGSNSESRKCALCCQISGASQAARQLGVFTPFVSMATAFAMRFCRVSSFFASSI